MDKPADRALRGLAAVIALGLVSSGAPIGADDLTAGLVAVGATPDLIVVYTGDVIGYLDPCG